MIYLDNAATSYPKPQSVVKAFSEGIDKYGGNPGRAGYDFSIKSAERVYETREILNSFFNGYGEEEVVFTPNCTYALNIAINGLARKGGHILISSLEHNSVLRPVFNLKKQGLIDFSVFKVEKETEKTIRNFKKSLRRNTIMCIVTAVSNVFGYVLPLSDLSEIAHNNGTKFLVDGAQAGGVIALDMKKQGIDFLCVPGHKGLYGPMGTGVLLHNGDSIKPLVFGGTGTTSLDYNQPLQYPERLESGTLNMPGISGLCEGVRFVMDKKIENIYEAETKLASALFDGLKSIKNIVCYEDCYDECFRSPVVCFNIKNKHSEEVALMLNEHDVCVRGGYHCSALAHIYGNTRSVGSVRVSPSFSNTKKDINYLLNLVEKIAIL